MRGNSVKNTSKNNFFERGNVFFTLFGAVAVVGVLGAGIMSTMRGPLTTMVNVNMREEAKAKMHVASRLLLTDDAVGGSGAANTDPDSDGAREPPNPATCAGVPANAGCLPSTISAEKLDPWGTNYAYCAWNLGSDTSATGNILEGDTDLNFYTIAIISAAQDKTFATTCGAAPPSVTPAGDDIVVTLTYQDSVAGSGGLWKIKSGAPDTATIAEKIEVNEAASFLGGLNMTGSSAALTLGAASVILPTQATLATCSEANNLLLRINTSGINPVLEMCDDPSGVVDNDWISVAEGASIWQKNGAEIYFNADNVGIGNNNPAFTLDVTGTFNASGAGIFNSTLNVNGNTTLGNDIADTVSITGILGVAGASTLSGDLIANANVTLGNAATDTVTIAGPTTIAETLGVTGTSTLSGDLIANANVTLGNAATDTVTIAGPTTIAETLDVTKKITGSADIETTGGKIEASGNVESGNNVTASNDVIALGGAVKYGAGGANDLTPPSCTATSEKPHWSGSSWSCEPDYGVGSGSGGFPTIQQVLAGGDDANDEDLIDLSVLGVNQICDSHTTTPANCVSQSDLRDANELQGTDITNSLVLDTTTTGQILVWDQTDSQWEVGTGADLTGVTATGVSLPIDVGSDSLIFVDVAGGNQPVLIHDDTNNVLAIGLNAGTALDHTNAGEGDNNTFIGINAGANTTKGNSNTLVGHMAGFASTTAILNTMIGNNSGANTTIGNFNTYLGHESGYENTIGISNVFLGAGAGRHAQSSFNVGVGLGALSNIIAGVVTGNSLTGDSNVALGHAAGVKTTTGTENTFLGHESGTNNTTGARNIIIGANIQNLTATTNDYINIGNTIFGDMGTNPTTAGTGDAALTIDGGLNITGALTTAVADLGLTGCTASQIIKRNAGDTAWECAADIGASGSDAISLRGEDLITTLATDTDTNGQILVWSQTNSQWEVGTGADLTGIPITLPIDVDSDTIILQDVDGGNQPVFIHDDTNNVLAIGLDAGTALDHTNAGEGDDNTLIGVDTGVAVTTGADNTLLGAGTGATNLNTESRNILIGSGVDTDNTDDYLNIGNVIYGDMGDTSVLTDSTARLYIDGDLSVTSSNQGDLGTEILFRTVDHPLREGIIDFTANRASKFQIKYKDDNGSVSLMRSGGFEQGIVYNKDSNAGGNGRLLFINGLGNNVIFVVEQNDTSVNNIAVDGGTTGNGPTLSSNGTDTNIDLNISAVGTGIVNVNSPLTVTGAFTNAITNFNITGCAASQVIKRNAGNTAWECAADIGASGSDAISLRGEDLIATLATDTTTDGQILVWSQTNTQWEVGTGADLTGIPITLPIDVDSDTLIMQDVDGGNQPVMIHDDANGVLAMGLNAGAALDHTNTGDGDNNTLYGKNAGPAVTTGSSNVLMGTDAGLLLKSGSRNTFIGRSAGTTTTNNNDNIFIGFRTGRNMTGNENVFIGKESGGSLGSFNFGLGEKAGNALNGGDGNIMIGDDSGDSITSGDYNITLGFRTSSNTTIGSNNIIIGRQINTPAVDTDNYLNIGQTIFGDMGTNPATAGTGDAAITIDGDLTVSGSIISAVSDLGLTGCTGSQVIKRNAGNTAWECATDATGTVTLPLIVDPTEIILEEVTSGNPVFRRLANGNILIGENAFANEDGGSDSQNTVLGSGAAENAPTSADFNTIIGFGAGDDITNDSMVIIGHKAVNGEFIVAPDGGYGSVVIGESAGYTMRGSGDSIVIGRRAGYLMNDADNNVIIGALAGDSLSSGDNNVFLGNATGSDTTTGSRNILLGNNIETTAATASRELNIGNVIYGTTGTTDGEADAKADASADITIDGDVNVTGALTTAVSDLGLTGCTGSQIIKRNAGNTAWECAADATGTVTFPVDVASATDDDIFKIGTTDLLSYHGVDNIFLGLDAGTATTADKNTFIGASAGASNILGGSNTFIGFEAGMTNSANKDQNTFVGMRAGKNASTQFSVFMGYRAGLNTSGSFNTLIGHDAGLSVAAGEYNTVLGQGAGGTNLNTENRNILIGYGVDTDNTSQHLNIGNVIYGSMGADAAEYAATGDESASLTLDGGLTITGALTTAVSDLGLTGCTSSQVIKRNAGNTAWECAADATGTVTFPVDVASATNREIFLIGTDDFLSYRGTQNTFLGQQSGNNGSGGNNVAFGFQAGSKTTQDQNVFIGSEAGENNVLGDQHVFIGYQAGQNVNTNVDKSIYIGSLAGREAEQTTSIMIGANAGQFHGATSVAGNILIGEKAGYVNDGKYVVALGYEAMGAGGGAADDTVAIGREAGHDLDTGDKNVVIGAYAGDKITTGQRNTVIGYNTDTPAVGTNYYINIANAIYGTSGTTNGEFDAKGDTSADLTIDGDLTVTGALTASITPSFPLDVSGATNDDIFKIGTEDFLSYHGTNNLYLGFEAGESSNDSGAADGGDNTFLGYRAGKTNTSGYDNTFIGANAGSNKAGGTREVTVIGQDAGKAITNNAMVIIGSSAVENGQGGYASIVIGERAGETMTASADSIVIGKDAMRSSNNARDNIAIGSFAGNTLDGNGNILLGYGTGSNAQGADRNILIGRDIELDGVNNDRTINIGNIIYGSIGASDTEYDAKGDSSADLTIDGDLTVTGNLTASITPAFPQDVSGATGGDIFTDGTNELLSFAGTDNVLIGKNAGDANSGQHIVAIGEEAAQDNTANYTVAIGYRAGEKNRKQGNVFVGENAGAKVTTNDNIAIGRDALSAETSGGNNVAIGTSAMETNGLANGNTAIGWNAYRWTGGGDGNTAIGSSAMRGPFGGGHAGGSDNTVIGNDAGFSISTGSGNIFLGHQAGDTNRTGNRNVLIGEDVDVATNSTSYYMNLANVIYGTIGTTDGEYAATGDSSADITIDGDVTITGSGTVGGVAITSDMRLKDKLGDLDKNEMLQRLTQLDGILYKLKGREDIQMGFSAQDMQKIFPELVRENKDGYLSVDYIGLIAPMTEAIKAQNQENKALRAEISALKQSQTHTEAALQNLNKQVDLLNKATISNVDKAGYSPLTIFLMLFGITMLCGTVFGTTVITVKNQKQNALKK